MARKTQLLMMFESLSCSSQAFRCYAVIKQTLKEAIKQAYKQNIKQASDYALIKYSNASRLSSGLHTAITAM
jgi:hypothetical protein